MPAATVSFVASSMRMNAPVAWRVGVGRDLAAEPQPHVRDVVERAARRRGPVERLEVDPAVDLVEPRRHGARAVLEQEAVRRRRRALAEPADVGARARARHRGVDSTAAISSPRARSTSSSRRTDTDSGASTASAARRRRAPRRPACARRTAARRPRRPAAARPPRAARRPSARRPRRAARAAPAAARRARRAARPDRLQALEQRRPGVPGHRSRALDDVVAVQRADRDELDLVQADLRGERRAPRRTTSSKRLLGRSRRGPSC